MSDLINPIEPEERILLEVDNVTEFYENGESVQGVLKIYLIIVREDEVFLHGTFPSKQSFPLPGFTQVERVENLMFKFSQGRFIERPFSIKLSDIEDADTLEVVFKQFCSLPEASEHGTLRLIDQEDGQEVGSLSNFEITESDDILYDKSPVFVELDQATGHAYVSSADNDTLTPQDGSDVILEYDGSDKILSAGAGISSLLIFATNKVSDGLESTADWWVKNRPAAEKPLVFTPKTKNNLQIASKYTGKSYYYTHKATKAISNKAASLGQKFVEKRDKNSSKSPGVFSRSMIAFSTVMDGLDQSTQRLLKAGTDSSSKMIGHSYGEEARHISAEFGRSIVNCTMVYVDARGVSRKAIVRGFGKGAVKGVFGSGNIVLKKKVNDKGKTVSSNTVENYAPPLPSRPSDAAAGRPNFDVKDVPSVPSTSSQDQGQQSGVLKDEKW